MAQSICTHLMFTGDAEAAIGLYTSLFPNSAITAIDRYGPGEMGAEGSVRLARFTLAGRDFLAIDSPVKHAFGFTPSMSIFVECESPGEFEAAFARLSEGGSILMPPDNYGFSTRFAWLTDRYGVSWQINLA
jgi:predicted 3-demethylubiquinone-9 3-methyltransferase (glyoxalase superfamily)